MGSHELIKIAGRFTSIRRDAVTGGIVMVAGAHHEVHTGDTYRSCHMFTVAPASTGDLNITIGAKEPHVTIQVSTEAESRFRLYEAAAFTTTVGTTANLFNLNRNSVKTQTVNVYYAPALATTGDELINEVLFGSAVGLGPNQQTFGQEIRNDTEFIFRKNTRYLMRVTNLLTTTKRITVNTQWYEEG